MSNSRERPNDDKDVVLLVHGTYARLRAFLMRSDADWRSNNSAACSVIRKALGEEALIYRFDWSGWNSPLSRSLAANRLAARICELHALHPGVRLHLVVHSHAGNIALYACRANGVATSVSSLVCLSTPFLYVSTRRLRRAAAERLEFVGGCAIAAVFVLLGLYAFPGGLSFLYHYFKTAPNGVFYGGLVLPALGIGLLIRHGLIPGLRRVHRWAVGFARDLRLPNTLPFPVLVVYRKRDEATAVLRSATFLTAQLSSIVGITLIITPLADTPCRGQRRPTESNRILRTLSMTRRIGSWALIIATSLIALMLGSAKLGVWSSHEALGVTAMNMVTLLVISAALYAIETWVLVLMMLPIIGICLLLACPTALYGLRFALAIIGLEIQAKPTPPPSLLRVTAIELPARSERRWQLRHTTHSDPEALSVMGSWLSWVKQECIDRGTGEQTAMRTTEVTHVAQP
jgi:hypothetical protein